MRYFTGEIIMEGDKVNLGHNENGQILGVINHDEKSKFMEEWGYLKKGFMVHSAKYGLVHYQEPDEDLIFLSRSKIEKSINDKKAKFLVGDEVIVSHVGGWKNNAKGIIVSKPECIETMQGDSYIYWVQFDEPQEDINDDHKYTKAQVLSIYITKYLA